MADGLVVAGVLTDASCAALAPDATVEQLLPHDAAFVLEGSGADLVLIEAAALLPGGSWAHAGDPAATDRGRRARRPDRPGPCAGQAGHLPAQRPVVPDAVPGLAGHVLRRRRGWRPRRPARPVQPDRPARGAPGRAGVRRAPESARRAGVKRMLDELTGGEPGNGPGDGVMPQVMAQPAGRPETAPPAGAGIRPGRSRSSARRRGGRHRACTGSTRCSWPRPRPRHASSSPAERAWSVPLPRTRRSAGPSPPGMRRRPPGSSRPPPRRAPGT